MNPICRTYRRFRCRGARDRRRSRATVGGRHASEEQKKRCRPERRARRPPALAVFPLQDVELVRPRASESIARGFQARAVELNPRQNTLRGGRRRRKWDCSEAKRRRRVAMAGAVVRLAPRRTCELSRRGSCCRRSTTGKTCERNATNSGPPPELLINPRTRPPARLQVRAGGSELRRGRLGELPYSVGHL